MNVKYIYHPKYLIANFYEYENFSFSEVGQRQEMTNGFCNLYFLFTFVMLLFALFLESDKKKEEG